MHSLGNFSSNMYPIYLKAVQTWDKPHGFTINDNAFDNRGNKLKDYFSLNVYYDHECSDFWRHYRKIKLDFEHNFPQYVNGEQCTKVMNWLYTETPKRKEYTIGENYVINNETRTTSHNAFQIFDPEGDYLGSVITEEFAKKMLDHLNSKLKG